MDRIGKQLDPRRLITETLQLSWKREWLYAQKEKWLELFGLSN